MEFRVRSGQQNQVVKIKRPGGDCSRAVALTRRGPFVWLAFVDLVSRMGRRSKHHPAASGFIDAARFRVPAQDAATD
jgi:hypothetical protein